MPEAETATTITREYWVVPLLRSLGFDPMYVRNAEVVDGQTYAISHRADAGENKPPIHVVGCRIDLEKRPPSGNPRLSAHALVQEYLNRTEHLWAIVTNGLRWRLLRDSSLMTRLTYVEFDLEQILNGENFAEFSLFYRLFHRSRLPQGVEDADECLLEFYHQESLQQGGRVRDRLRDGVEKALLQFGNGFLQHKNSEELRSRFASGKITATDYYRQLLRLIYRLLFLMVAEARDLLLEESEPEKRRVYQEYYSVERLRLLAERPTWRREGFQDLWQGLRVTFRLFEGDAENWRGEMLGLSPLNGDLFGTGTLNAIDSCGLDNYDFLNSIRYLSLYEQKGQQRRVNYAAIDVEEFGSVYESLLDFHPQVRVSNGRYEFLLVSGSERKTTGSYYTPRELVQQLIKSALEPVMEERLADLKTQAEQEAALLDLKVIDPACGSGHFLLAAARRLGLELARVRTGEAEPGERPRREAQRSIIQNCIYGVDLNPLAVDLCKVGLWIEGFCKGRPLNFLDHRIKCGNSLVGVLDLECLKEGIPDEAYKPVTGDEKAIASDLKKRNKKERSQLDQMTIFEQAIESELPEIAEKWRDVGALPEETAADVRSKKARSLELRSDRQWWSNVEACNLWTAAFFMPLTSENLAVLPTSEALARYLREKNRPVAIKNSMPAMVEAANQLAQEKRFFHWALEFPEVFEQGGFDCVLGNPPWEMLQISEQEFFTTRKPEIAILAGDDRKKAIKILSKTDLKLAKEFEDFKFDTESQNRFLKESNRFPLTSTGKINTYAMFAEISINLISQNGRVGVILPVGIATDDTTRRYFSKLVENDSLISITGFENESFIFPSVHHAFKFCTLVATGSKKPNHQTRFVFFCRHFTDINNEKRVFELTPQEIILMNPNTKTCPVFRSREDAELSKKIYQISPVLDDEDRGINPWGIILKQGIFNMTTDSSLFLKNPGEMSVPLYEAKMLHQFDHRYSSYEKATQANLNSGILPQSTDLQKENFDYQVKTRYWVSFEDLKSKVADKWKKKWLLAIRDIARNTDVRTCISSFLPFVATSGINIVFVSVHDTCLVSCLGANLNSLIFDYVVRQKVAGTHLSHNYLKQLPVLPPEAYTQANIDFIVPRVLELVYTAWDMKPFAEDMGYSGDPFTWNRDRRAQLRAELDAYYAYLYGLDRDELRYILDPTDVYGADFPSETFRVLKNNEIKQFGEYRTQRLVLEAWDKLFSRSSKPRSS